VSTIVSEEVVFILYYGWFWMALWVRGHDRVCHRLYRYPCWRLPCCDVLKRAKLLDQQKRSATPNLLRALTLS